MFMRNIVVILVPFIGKLPGKLTISTYYLEVCRYPISRQNSVSQKNFFHVTVSISLLSSPLHFYINVRSKDYVIRWFSLVISTIFVFNFVLLYFHVFWIDSHVVYYILIFDIIHVNEDFHIAANIHIFWPFASMWNACFQSTPLYNDWLYYLVIDIF